MTLPENSSQPSAPGPTGKPSLMGAAAASAGAAGDVPTQPMRMLDSLDAAPARRASPSSGQRTTLLFALGLGVIAAAAYGWWESTGSSGVSPALIEASRQSRAAAPTPMQPLPAAPAQEASSAVAVAEPAADPSSGPASIERTALADPAPFTPRPFGSAPVPPVPPAPRATTSSTSPTAPTAPTAAASSPFVAPVVAPRVAAAATPPRAVPRAAPPVVADASPAPPSGDPDVTLLSAMLARLSGDNAAAAPRPTIAQLVERCEAQSAKDSIEAFDCKRRICAGYWGKADACPLALAPRKN